MPDILGSLSDGQPLSWDLISRHVLAWREKQRAQREAQEHGTGVTDTWDDSRSGRRHHGHHPSHGTLITPCLGHMHLL